MASSRKRERSAERNAQTSLNTFDELPDDARVKLSLVARLHGVSEITVRRWAKSGILPPPVKVGGLNLWNVGALRRSLSAPA
jgi:hypothetical protein